MTDAGYAHMGTGRASGKEKAVEAAKMAIKSPLLETSIDGAKRVVVYFTCSEDISLEEVEDAAAMVQEAAHPDVHLIWGAAIDDNLEDEVRLSIIATRFDTEPPTKPGETPRKIKAPVVSEATQEKAFTEAPEAAQETAAKKDEEIDEAIDVLLKIFDRDKR